MDENKRLVLQQIDYNIQKSCGMCIHSSFVGSGNFGDCRVNKYEHLKHTDRVRNLSIHRYGSCPKFEWKTVDQFATKTWKEFINETRIYSTEL